MPHHPNILSRALLVCALALAMQLGAQERASGASECLTRPHSRTESGGHWYYRVDRARHRKCWFVEPTPATAAHASAPPEQYSPVTTANQSLFSWLTAGFQQTFSVGTPQSNPSDEPPATTDKVVPKHSKMRAGRVKHLHVASRYEEKAPAAVTVRLSPARRDALFEEFQQFLKLRETDGYGAGGR